MKDTDIAYIAGLIDGEAYIGIKKTTALRNGRVNPSFHERIQIRMVDEPAISFITNMLGGNYYKEKPSVSHGRPLFCYQASDLKAVKILEAILPYLRVKRRVALTVLDFRRLKNNPDKVQVISLSRNRWGQIQEFRRWRYSPRHIQACNDLYERCKRLNKVGI